MRYYQSADANGILAIFERGDLLLEGLESIVRQEGISTAAITSGIGSLDRCHIHWITSTGIPSTNEFRILEGPVEVASIQGSVIGGQVHAHMCVSDLSRTYTGHLEPDSRVCYRAEVCLTRLDGIELVSQVNPRTGLVEIVPSPGGA